MPRRLDPSYDDSHRAFLQAFMARGTLTYSEAQPLLAAILTAHAGETVAPEAITQDIFAEYITAVGNAVSDLDYEVRSSLPQKVRSARTGDGSADVDADDDDDDDEDNNDAPERVYALINATSDDLTQLATTFSPDELAFVKRVLDEMFDHGGGGGGGSALRRELCGLQGSRALQLHAPLRDRDARDAAARRRASAQGNTTLTQQQQDADDDDDNDGTQMQGTQGGARAQAISMTQAQAVLDGLVAQGWFERSRKGFYSLTPRALMELRTWLIDTYNDEDDDMADGNNDDDNNDDDDDGGGAASGRRIKLCQACREIVTVGQRCPKLTCPVRLHDGCTRRFFRMQKAERCPACKSDWGDHGYVGERAAAAAAGQGQRRRTTGAVASQPKSQRRRRSSGMDGAGDDDNDEEDEDDEEDESMQ